MAHFLNKLIVRHSVCFRYGGEAVTTITGRSFSDKADKAKQKAGGAAKKKLKGTTTEEEQGTEWIDSFVNAAEKVKR